MRNVKYIDIVLWAMWGGIATLTIELSYIIYYAPQESKGPLIGAMAILLSAAVASASVMKNIAETKAHDIAKGEKEKERKHIFTSTTMQAIYSTIGSLKEYQSSQPADIQYHSLMANMDTVQKLIDSIFSESILAYLPENEKNDISKFYISFNEFLFLKKISVPVQNNQTEADAFDELIKLYKERFGKSSKEYIDKYKSNKENEQQKES